MAVNSALVGTGDAALSYGNGSPALNRAGNLGDLIVSKLQPDYYEGTYRRHGFSASIQSVATSTVGLATTYTGLCLSNPVGSGYNLVLTLGSMMQSVLQATQIEAFAVAVGFNAATNVTHTAGITPVSNLIGSGAVAVAKADSSATLPTAPTYHTFVQNTATATANGPGSVIDFKGSVILTPGAYACWVTPAQASVAGMWFSFSWIETPV